MIKKVFIIILLLTIGYLILKDNRIFINNEAIDNYQAENLYEEQYPVNNYVDEKLNNYKLLRNIRIKYLIESDDILVSEKRIWELIKIFFVPEFWGLKVQNLQYVEPQTVDVIDVEDDEERNYEYVGYLEDGTEVSGNIAIFDNNGDYSVAISLYDGETVNEDSVLLLSDDSNAEMLAYQIVYETQKLYGTEMEPNAAAQHYYNVTIEEMAGSISYHAILTYYFINREVNPEMLEHVAIINISYEDWDGQFINHSY